MQTRILDALRDGDVANALQLARTAVSESPDDPAAHSTLALALQASGDVPGALSAIDTALALAPEDAGLHMLRASLLAAGDDIGGAEAALAQTVALDPNQLRAYIMQAQFALGRGDLDEAERLRRLAARLAPDHPHVIMVEGVVALQRGDADTALKLLVPAFSRAPGDTQLRYALGFAYLAKGHLAFAEQTIRGLVDLPGGRFDGMRVVLADILRRQGRTADALETIAPLVAEGTTPPDGIVFISAGLQFEAGHPEVARTLLLPLFARNPSDERIVGLLAEAWAATGDQDGARSALDAALATSPGADATWRARLAFAPDAASALEVAQRWADASPTLVEPLVIRMRVYMAEGDVATSEAEAHRIVALEPGHAAAELQIVDALFARDPDAAIARVHALLAEAGSSFARQRLQDWLAVTLDRAGRHAEAVDAWRAGLASADAQLPAIADDTREWPVRGAADTGADEHPLFVVGLPGCGGERVAGLLQAAGGRVLVDRIRPAGAAPDDVFARPDAAAARVDGGTAPDTLVAAWRTGLVARSGAADANVIEWLQTWDNGLLSVLRPALPSALLLFVLRDPRDALLDWIAFGGPGAPLPSSTGAAAQWLATALGHVARVAEEDLFLHRVLRIDGIEQDTAKMRAAIGQALSMTVPETPPLVPERFPSGHWRAYADVLKDEFAVLAPVAQRLGYPAG